MTKNIFKFGFVFFVLIISSFLIHNMSVSGFAYAGVDISGLSQKKAQEKAIKEISESKSNINLSITFEDKKYVITEKDLQIGNIEQVVAAAIENNKGKTFFEMINIFKNSSKKIVIPTANLFDGFDKKIEKIKSEVEREPVEPEVIFKPKEKVMFKVKDGLYGVKVNSQELMSRITNSLEENLSAEIALPVILTPPKHTKEEVSEKLKKRAEFSTNYSSSVGGRRNNVLLSLSAFNGMSVGPNQIVSFNKTINSKIPFSSFEVAKIIVNGEFVDGRGGGMCQASSTLYNALLLADMEILEAHNHTLPVGYVKVGFDAMVNPGTADLIFKNTLDYPIYIKTYGDQNDCYVEIYGEDLPKGLVIKRKSEFVRSIKHQGDKIIPDKEGRFSDKVLFKGEYHRVKYPVEGCEANSYLQYYVDGELVEERFVRHSHYNAQQGIVYEGTEEMIEGLIAPTSSQNFIPPATENQAEYIYENKIKSYNPPHFNP